MTSERLIFRVLQLKILEVFAENPGGCDSAEGIADFWLAGEDTQKVNQGLRDLVVCGVIRCSGQGHSAIYHEPQSHLVQDIIQSYAN